MLIHGIAILVWGIQCDMLWAAIPMALLTEAGRFFNRRWDLTRQDFYRVSDLTTLALVGLVIFLVLNARTYHFLTTLLELLPLLLFPLTIVISYSTTRRMPLDVMFYSLRRQRDPVTQSWDLEYLLLGACLLATATNTRDYPQFFFPYAGFIILASLYNLRSPRFRPAITILALAAIFIAGTLTHMAIRGSHLAFKAKTEEWISQWIRDRSDPYKTRTALGRVGRLKLSDTIVFRVAADRESFPRLLREAAYDQPGHPAYLEWNALKPRFNDVPHADDFAWRIQDPAAGEKPARFYLEFERDRDLVPLPANIASISDLPALQVAVNAYGAVQGRDMVPSPYFEITYRGDSHLSSAADRTDLHIPLVYQRLLARTSLSRSGSDAEAVQQVQDYLAGFSYSLFQPDEVALANPLEVFLFERQAGHCEYFATATTLLLRHLGVPARYAVGYAVDEYDEGLGMYLVRQRHAHAWAEAWVDGRWRIVDTTPGTWYGMERDAMHPLRPVLDFLANHLFRFQQWWNQQRLADYEVYLYAIGAILLVILLWRIATSEQVILERETDAATASPSPGADSPFYDIEADLAAAGLGRGSAETFESWLERIGHDELRALLLRHNRLRFDPDNPARQDEQLTMAVTEWRTRHAEAENP